MNQNSKTLVIYAVQGSSTTLSYQTGWPYWFKQVLGKSATLLNLLESSTLSRTHAISRALLGKYDVIIILHSVFSNSLFLSPLLIRLIAKCRGKKICFVGNEYKLMPEKIEFYRNINVDLLISQTHSPEIHQLYRDALSCDVRFVPSAGLNSDLFFPITPLNERTIDIGYRALAISAYLGHDERAAIGEYFLKHSKSLTLKNIDISMDESQRFTPPDWNLFLNKCRGQLGVEGGSDYFELTDHTRNQVNLYLQEHPSASFQQIKNRFFANYVNPIPCRVISGRHIEAAATKTVQILFEGEYGGYLKPNEHYLPLKKDFSNIDEIMRQFKDDEYCQKITQTAFDLVHSELTYQRLISKLDL